MIVAEYRKIRVAPGHDVTVYRAPRQSNRPGFVTVSKSHRQPFDVRAEAWLQGEIVRNG